MWYICITRNRDKRDIYIMADTIEFHRVSLEDRDKVLKYLELNPYCNCDFSFGNLYNWGFYYNTEIAFHKDMMVVRFQSDNGEREAFLMPIGIGDPVEVLQDMEHTINLNGQNLTLMAVQESALELLHRTYPENLHIIKNRDNADYIYDRESLATLAGKRLQSKRNHVNKFKRLYPDWQYEEINHSNAQECIALQARWFGETDQREELQEENRMVNTALHEWDQIGLRGGCIRVDGEVIAFTLGMRINPHCFGVHIEKADTAYDGAFAIINQEFAKRLPEHYLRINREEDLGVPGLRKAKLSYKPMKILDKHTVVLRYGEDHL